MHVVPGPERWSHLAPAAKGLHQSPVDLVLREVVSDPFVVASPLRINYVSTSCRWMQNTGHGFQIGVTHGEDARSE